jgi:hypothetical protein
MFSVNLARLGIDKQQHVYSLDVLKFDVDGKCFSLLGIHVNDFGIAYEVAFSSLWYDELKKRFR